MVSCGLDSDRSGIIMTLRFSFPTYRISQRQISRLDQPMAWIPMTVLGGLLLFLGGWSFLLWGIFFRTVVNLHSTWLVNSATHMWGSRRFSTGDTSRNDFWVALLTFGEGWHSNHHAHPQSARHGWHGTNSIQTGTGSAHCRRWACVNVKARTLKQPTEPLHGIYRATLQRTLTYLHL